MPITQLRAPSVEPEVPSLEGPLTHWREYFMEAAGLGLFMLSACTFGVLLEHPASPLHQAINVPILRRALMGTAMGLTAIGIICSPWGKRSGAHLNPSVTLTFFSLGKIHPWDACLYIAAQFIGGILGVRIAELLIGLPLRHSAVNYVVTMPGQFGIATAFIAEWIIATVLMLAVLFASNSRRLARWTPFIAGSLVALYILVEAPISGMSMNPARSFGSAFAAGEWKALWIYFTAPPLGMLCAGQIFRALKGKHAVLCAKLHHHNRARCIFRCEIARLTE